MWMSRLSDFGIVLPPGHMAFKKVYLWEDRMAILLIFKGTEMDKEIK